MSNKREKDRESGTGQPIKSIPSKGGSGKGNWGSDQEQIKQGMDSLNANDANSKPKRKEPDSFGDLNDSEASKPKQSWDEFNKAKGKKKAEVYSKKTVRSDYRKKYKPNKYEQETDAMFAGSSNKRNKKRKKKKKKVLLQTAVHYNEEPKARGRGRGGGSYGNNMRGGGYRGRGSGRGSYGGFNQQRGGGGYGGYNNQRGGYRRGGGFGSRGRGSFNNDYDNNQNYQNQNQYQPSSSNQNNQQNNNGQQAQQQQPNNANNANQDNVNIPVTVQ